MTLTNEPLFGPPYQSRLELRATRVPVTHRKDIDAEIWIGGADTAIGEELTDSHLSRAWLIDCAGDIPTHLRKAALAFFPRVFSDAEVVPHLYDRLESLARDISAAMRGDGSAGALAHHPRPERLYVMCKQGFNRSALVAGLILRELGAEPAQVVETIRLARPGALTNQTFVRLLLGEG